MSKTGFSSNLGYNCPPGVVGAEIVAGTHQTATDAATGGDHTFTVVAGADYIVNATQQSVFGLADITTATNVRWVCPGNGSCLIHIPIDGGTTLHYMSDVNGGIIRIGRLA